METLKAYFAGLFDGEGCVTVRKDNRGNSRSYQLICTVAMTEPKAVRLLHFCYGGSLTIRDKGEHKTAFQWTVASDKALEFLYSITPNLRVKRPEAELAIQFQENVRAYRYQFGNGKNHPDQEACIDMRDYVFHELKRLKRINYSVL